MFCSSRSGKGVLAASLNKLDVVLDVFFHMQASLPAREGPVHSAPPIGGGGRERAGHEFESLATGSVFSYLVSAYRPSC